jgi:hypothetical protein
MARADARASLDAWFKQVDELLRTLRPRGADVPEATPDEVDKGRL